MARMQRFDLSISKKKLLKNLSLVMKFATLKQNFHSYLYLETHREGKTAHSNNHAEKEVERKELITSFL